MKSTAKAEVQVLTVDINGDSTKDIIKIFEQQYWTVFDNGENGGFVLPYLQAEVNGKIYRLQLGKAKGYHGLITAFGYYIEDLDSNCVIAFLEYDANHFAITELVALAFTDQLVFLKLPQTKKNEGRFSEAFYSPPIEICFDSEDMAIKLVNEEIGYSEAVSLSDKQCQIIENAWFFPGEIPIPCLYY